MNKRTLGFIGALILMGFIVEIVDNFSRNAAWALVFIVLFGMFLQNNYSLWFINNAISQYNRAVGNN